MIKPGFIRKSGFTHVYQHKAWTDHHTRIDKCCLIDLSAAETARFINQEKNFNTDNP